MIVLSLRIFLVLIELECNLCYTVKRMIYLGEIMNKKYIFFDFDGTLVDTSAGIFDSVIYAYKKMGLPYENVEFRKFIGPPLEWSFMNISGLNKEDAVFATESFRENYREKGVFMHTIYKDVKNMLEALKNKGKVLAVATSKPEKFAKQILSEYDLEKYFDFVSGATFDGSRSSKKDVLKYAISKINPDSLNNCVLVGDTKNDVFGAKEVGMDCIGILYGFGSEQELKEAGAVLTLENPLDVVMQIN